MTGLWNKVKQVTPGVLTFLKKMFPKSIPRFLRFKT